MNNYLDTTLPFLRNSLKSINADVKTQTVVDFCTVLSKHYTYFLCFSVFYKLCSIENILKGRICHSGTSALSKRCCCLRKRLCGRKESFLFTGAHSPDADYGTNITLVIKILFLGELLSARETSWSVDILYWEITVPFLKNKW